jgi:hypothetical protein
VRRIGLVIVALLLAAAAPVGAVELDRGDLRLDLSGQLRSVYTFTRLIDAEDLLLTGSTRRSDSWLLLTRARAGLEGVWRERVYGELVYDNEVRTGSALDSIDFWVANEIGTQTWLDADRVISRHADGDWRHSLYRAWLRYEADAFELTLGRQRIPLGRGRLWNPTDLFNPIGPLAIEGDQRIGQDAALLRVSLSDDFRAVGIWSPQDDPDDHRAALRLELDHPDLDAALMAGRFRRDRVFGADFAINLGDAALRGEATYTDLEGHGRIWQAVASLDYTFSVGTGLYALVEHLYNENTVSADFLITELVVGTQVPLFDRIVTVSEDLTGAQLSYEFSPFWQGGLLCIYDWHGASAAIAPSLSFTPRSDLVLTAAGQLFWGGDSDTQYGRQPGILILQVELYF